MLQIIMAFRFTKITRNLLDKFGETSQATDDIVPPPLVFMHIPKTAGTSLVHALRAAVQPRREVGGHDRCLFGPFTGFNTMDPQERAGIYERLEDMPADGDMVAGHISLSTLRAVYPAGRMMTVLRDPMSRLLSHWLFWRQQSDEALRPVGGWADYVRKSREPLADFLGDPSIAFQTDNLALRMLLWPHRLIAADAFIDPADDEALVWEATKRLHAFDFVDIVESGDLQANLAAWLGRDLPVARLNETSAVPPAFRTPLHREFTAAAHEALVARSRLDLRLWMSVAAMRLNGADAAALRERVILSNVARYSTIMAA